MIADNAVPIDDDIEPGPGPRPWVPVLFAMATGILLDRWFAVSLAWSWTAATVFLATWATAWYTGRRLSEFFLWAAVAAVACGAHHLHWSVYDAREICRYSQATPQPVCLVARVHRDLGLLPADNDLTFAPASTHDTAVYVIKVTAVRNGQRWERASGVARLYIESFTEKLRPGDLVSVFGRMLRYAPPGNPGEFDLATYRRGFRTNTVITTSYAAAVTRTAVNPVERYPIVDWMRWIGYLPRRLMDALRERCKHVIDRHLGESSRSLAAATLLGERSEIPGELNERLLASGLLHILAISGLHVGIVAGLVLWYCEVNFHSYRWMIGTTWSATIFYTLLCGAPPSAVRACVLISFFCAAEFMRVWPHPINSLAGAAVFLLVANPSQLFHTGFHLSFIAAATLFAAFGPNLSPPEEEDPLERLYRAFRPAWLRQLHRFATKSWTVLWGGGLVWLVTAPLVLAKFHICAPVGIVGSFLAWIPLTAGLASGIVMLPAGMISSWLAWVPSAICGPAFNLLRRIVDSTAAIPGGHFYGFGPPDWWLIGFYGILGGLFFFDDSKRPSWKTVISLTGAWIALGFTVGAWQSTRPQTHLQIDVLSVGHGCATVVELPDHRILLYDAGGFGSPRRCADRISGVLWEKGRRRIDTVVISHPDVDHFNALPSLIERFEIGRVYVTPIMLEDDAPAVRRLIDEIRRADIPILPLDRRYTCESAGCRLDVLHPPTEGIIGNDNANSLVLLVSAGNRHVLLTGDLAPPGVQMLLDEPPVDCDVLVAPHHGSRSSNPAGLIEWSRPEFVIVSGSPSQGTAIGSPAGVQVYHTAFAGTVSIRMPIVPNRLGNFPDLSVVTARASP
ncbi:ComEC/Rec2 family competence protein [Thermostilla marina]